MGKVKKNRHSLAWKFFIYMPLCFVVALLGSFGIGVATNYVQDWYRSTHSDIEVRPGVYYELYIDERGRESMVFVGPDESGGDFENQKYRDIYWLISNAQMVLIPVWIFFCVLLTGVWFYRRELKKPIDILLEASRRIADNDLDFKVAYKKQNELGMLCSAFDEMRSSLYESNLEMWRSLEERKRLNSAFSHDLRTPLTVLKGYAEYLEKYIPDGKVPEEKLLSVISMMNGQITRLEHYTQKMNAVQKLEDIVPHNRRISSSELSALFTETGTFLCGERFRINSAPNDIPISIDTELVMQVYENLISNAVRYAHSMVQVECSIAENRLRISVLDDGRGFTEEALRNAAQPFFRDEKEPDKLHFGLGLYICRILCEKCGGALTIANHANGGKVTAVFSCGEISGE